MKSIFIIASLIGLVYLVLQTSSGERWLHSLNQSVLENIKQSADSLTDKNINKHEGKSPLNKDDRTSEQVHLPSNTQSKSSQNMQQTFEKYSQAWSAEAKALNAQNKALSKQILVLEQRLSAFEKQHTKVIEDNVSSQIHADSKSNDLLELPLDSKKMDDRKNRIAQQAKLQDLINRMELASLNLVK